MSPTSFQTAPPRDIESTYHSAQYIKQSVIRIIEWMGVDSNHRSHREPIHIKPMIGLEPITC